MKLFILNGILTIPFGADGSHFKTARDHNAKGLTDMKNPVRIFIDGVQMDSVGTPGATRLYRRPAGGCFQRREHEKPAFLYRRFGIGITGHDRLNHLKTDLMATISHETRTPLAIMSNYAELIAMGLRRKGVDKQTASDLDSISDEILRIVGIMEEMQKFSRAKDSSTRKGWVRLADIINRCVKFYAPILELKGIGLHVKLPENLPMIFANAGELTQVMFNLMQNARNHTENGMVIIDASSGDEDGEPVIVVTVSDTGTGVAPEFLPQTFERYAHDDLEGMGIGLSVCREVVEEHGGSIEIESLPERGTTVRFAMPINREEAEDGQKSLACRG